MSGATLPAGKTCGDCTWSARCSLLFGCKTTNTECDWIPHRFDDAIKRAARDEKRAAAQSAGEKP